MKSAHESIDSVGVARKDLIEWESYESHQRHGEYDDDSIQLDVEDVPESNECWC